MFTVSEISNVRLSMRLFISRSKALSAMFINMSVNAVERECAKKEHSFYTFTNVYVCMV